MAAGLDMCRHCVSGSCSTTFVYARQCFNRRAHMSTQEHGGVPATHAPDRSGGTRTSGLNFHLHGRRSRDGLAQTGVDPRQGQGVAPRKQFPGSPDTF